MSKKKIWRDWVKSLDAPALGQTLTISGQKRGKPVIYRIKRVEGRGFFGEGHFKLDNRAGTMPWYEARKLIRPMNVRKASAKYSHPGYKLAVSLSGHPNCHYSLNIVVSATKCLTITHSHAMLPVAHRGFGWNYKTIPDTKIEFENPWLGKGHPGRYEYK